MKYRKQIKFLVTVGTKELPHTGRSLYDHLIGTARLLIKHGRPEKEVLAGLFHSIYGTVYYTKSKHAISVGRTEIQDLIGEDAEELVWVFCKTNNRLEKMQVDDWFPDQWRESLQWIEYCNLVDSDHHNKAAIDKIYRNLRPWK